MTPINNSRNVCPYCHEGVLVTDYEHGEKTCNKCYMVVEDIFIDQGKEWRSFDGDQSRERTGSASTYTLHDKGLSTDISSVDRDASGRRLSASQASIAYNLRKWHKRTRIANGSQRSLVTALKEIGVVCEQMNLPKDMQEAICLTYRKAAAKRLARGRSVKLLVAAVVYLHCKEANIPRTLVEMSKVSGVPKKDLGRAYRVLSTTLGRRPQLSTPESYVPRFVSELGADMALLNKCRMLINDGNVRSLFVGRSPVAVAAASIYAAGHKDYRLTQTRVSEVTGISEVTIRVISKDMEKSA